MATINHLALLPSLVGGVHFIGANDSGGTGSRVFRVPNA